MAKHDQISKETAGHIRVIDLFAKRGEWDRLCAFACGYPGDLYDLEALKYAFKYFDEIPDPETRYWFAIRSYLQGGDGLAIVRKAVRSFKGSPYRELPEEYQERDYPITVYRAGRESINKTAERLSWTTSRTVAEWFAYVYQRKKGGRHSNLYMAEIDPKEVIACTNARGEQEIIQYKSVKNIEQLPVEMSRFRKGEDYNPVYFEKWFD